MFYCFLRIILKLNSYMIFLNKIIISIIPFLPKGVVRFFSKKYVAGIDNSDALNAVKILNYRKESATIDILGEHTSSIKECNDITNAYVELLNKINIEKLDCNLSIKPSHIGSDLNYKSLLINYTKILKEASMHNNFIRIDMESSKLTDTTIKLYNDLKLTSSNIGIVFQAYLHRTEKDINKLEKGSNIRLCKGIYKEDSSIAYQNYNEINKNYLKLLKIALEKELYVAIATHDKALIKECVKLVEKERIEKNKFEFQYLYGVPMNEHIEMYKNKNFKIRAYVPFGKDWYDYSIRRIKENPKIASYVLKNIFS
ncbi:MAG: proline dehydrogenase [Candidatus Marinimicrobia bacterium]|nr:proline dehydrogenase [Candidatus Neomarinimicrobiota bacterium]